MRLRLNMPSLIAGELAGGAAWCCKSFPQELPALVRSYGYDTLIPFAAYVLINGLGVRTSLAGAIAFGGTSVLEIAQRYGLYPGTYDPKDFIAYALGTGTAILLDKVTSKEKLRLI